LMVLLALIVEPFIDHSASEPVVLCRHSRSALPSPVKSAMSAIDQDESGAALMVLLETMFDPLMLQSVTVPVPLCRHSTSAAPLPSRSPTPATLHVASGATALPPAVTLPLVVIVAPLIPHSASPPPACRHNTLDCPLALKSLVASVTTAVMKRRPAPSSVTLALPWVPGVV